MPQRKRSREEWAEYVAELDGSALSIGKFAKWKGLNPSTLGWWRWKLRSERVGCDDLEPRFVPVVVMADEGEPREVRRKHGLVEAVLPGGVELRFEHALDLAGLRELAGAFSSLGYA